MLYSRATSTCVYTREHICHIVETYKDHLVVISTMTQCIPIEGGACQTEEKIYTINIQKYSCPNRQGVTSRATTMYKLTRAALASIRVMSFVFCMLSVLCLYTRHRRRGCDCPSCNHSSSRWLGSTLKSL